MSSTSKHNLSSLVVTMKLNNLINLLQSCSVDFLVLADRKRTPNSTSGLPLLHENSTYIAKEWNTSDFSSHERLLIFSNKKNLSLYHSLLNITTSLSSSRFWLDPWHFLVLESENIANQNTKNSMWNRNKGNALIRVNILTSHDLC